MVASFEIFFEALVIVEPQGGGFGENNVSCTAFPQRLEATDCFAAVWRLAPEFFVEGMPTPALTVVNRGGAPSHSEDPQGSGRRNPIDFTGGVQQRCFPGSVERFQVEASLLNAA